MKKLFNLDLHISVIADFKDVLGRQQSSLSLTDWSISQHTWVFRRKPNRVKVVNGRTWKRIDRRMIQQFQRKYDEYLEQFDAFVVTHTPVFCLLFEKYGKPIILINSCRYEQPFCWTGDLHQWEHLDARLHAMWARGQLIAVCNNKADLEYLRLGTGIEATHIPSLCLYTNSNYQGDKRELLIAGAGLLPEYRGLPNVVDKNRALRRRYEWQDLYRYRGMIVFPYEISTMSIFEMYSANMPLFFPCMRLLKRLLREKAIPFCGPYARGAFPEKLELALGAEWVDFWVDRADFYDLENMPHIVYFDSAEDLREKSSQIDPMELSERMALANRARQAVALAKWRQILDRVTLGSRGAAEQAAV